MKTIILFLVSMIILSGCENPFNFEGLQRFGTLGTKDTKEDFWERVEVGTRRVYTAKVEVRMENGNPCLESFITLKNTYPYQIYFCNNFGDVFIKTTFFITGNHPSDSQECSIRTYMDQNNPPIIIDSQINLKLGDSYPTLTIVFPDSLAYMR